MGTEIIWEGLLEGPQSLDTFLSFLELLPLCPPAIVRRSWITEEQIKCELQAFVSRTFTWNNNIKASILLIFEVWSDSISILDLTSHFCLYNFKICLYEKEQARGEERDGWVSFLEIYILSSIQERRPSRWCLWWTQEFGKCKRAQRSSNGGSFKYILHQKKKALAWWHIPMS